MEVDEYTEIGLGRQGPNGLMTGQIYPWLFLTNFGGLRDVRWGLKFTGLSPQKTLKPKWRSPSRRLYEPEAMTFHT